jgi:NADH-quinone oxidoreductase subunit K
MFFIKYEAEIILIIFLFFLTILDKKSGLSGPRAHEIDLKMLSWDGSGVDGISFYYSDYDCLVIDEVPVKFYLFFSFSLFFLGILGIVFNRKSLINLMLCVELMLFGASLNFIFFSIFLSLPSGQIFALIIITIAAADSAVGLGILIAAFYLKRNISFEAFASLKG